MDAMLVFFSINIEQILHLFSNVYVVGFQQVSASWQAITFFGQVCCKVSKINLDIKIWNIEAWTAANFRNVQGNRKLVEWQNTAWKVSIFGVILVPIVQHLDWIWTRITPNTHAFYAVEHSCSQTQKKENVFWKESSLHDSLHIKWSFH